MFLVFNMNHFDHIHNQNYKMRENNEKRVTISKRKSYMVLVIFLMREMTCNPSYHKNRQQSIIGKIKASFH